jgi:hypothetical protein
MSVAARHVTTPSFEILWLRMKACQRRLKRQREHVAKSEKREGKTSAKISESGESQKNK